MRWILALILGLTAQAALATLNVVVTTASMGMLAREVGGDAVRVTVLAPSDRDPHMLQAKPSMIRQLRDADLVVAVGAELEQGWLPAAISSSANPRLLVGRPGYFEAAAQVDLLESNQAADRALGDVHPAGNPHLHMDPVRMGQVAMALAERLARLQPALGPDARLRASRFVAAVQDRLPGWQSRSRGAPGVVLFHKDAIYLTNRFSIPVHGYLEPVPGVPPGARHLQTLTSRLQGKPGVVVRHAYQPAQAAERLAGALGWPVRVLPLEPSGTAGAEAYFQFLDAWVNGLAGRQ